MPLQHTIGTTVLLSGVGLHTGQTAMVKLHPAAENYGIRFMRTDVASCPEIEADIDNVVDLQKGTAIGKSGVTIHTIEHLMAALSGLEVDNVRVEVNAPELPLMDGSALPFVELIEKAGKVEQPAQREFITIDEPVLLYQDNETAYSIFPSDHFHLTLMTDYGHRHVSLAAQHTTLFSLKDFTRDFAPARTFCFLSEIEQLREKGIIKGGTLDSAVVVQDVELTKEHVDYIRTLFDYKGPIAAGENGCLNNVKLRFYNELCRHKALDLIGDLYLLGKPLLGHILAAKTSHANNHTLAQKIREYVRKRDKKRAREQDKKITHEDILKLLPHRYPFLLIDGVIEIEPRKRAICYKNVSFNEPFFQGHFPGDPVMPGVLQVEAMAQAGGIMGLYGTGMDKDRVILFLGLDNVRFRGVVRPGDMLRIETEMLQDRRSTIKFSGKCYVGDKLVCEAELLAMLGKK
jgi:UDP-3-O-[3-hydroxymyristoyl] N-acetylglucosamine deacetylase/3-hydroxyacyl-[acyl-carrier-protein] dehydratase